MAELPEFAPDEPIVPLDQPEFSPNEPISPLTGAGSQRQRAFREQIRKGEPEQAAQTSFAGEKLAVPLPPIEEQPKTGMFLDRDEKGNLVAREMPITGGMEPRGIKRITESAKMAFGEQPYGFSPETLKQYPSLGVLQPFVGMGDVLLRDIRAAMAGGAGAVAAVAEKYGLSLEQADELQRDIFQGMQVVGAEMPKPTPGMMKAPIVKAAEAPAIETINFMTGKPPVPPKPAITLPTVPIEEGIPVPEVRGKGARLLPPETPHEPIALPSRAGVGAEAAAGPLEGISPEAISQVARQLKADNWTPWTIDERLEKMSPHQFLAEVSPNLENKASQVAAYGGEGRNTIKTNVDQRHTEIKPRLKVLYDEAFGPVENLAQERKILTVEQKAAADEFYKKFRDIEIHPTEELKDMMPRLEAAGAFGEAKKIAAVEGKPWEENFFTTGERKNYPTAESWDYVKRALDSKIEGSFNQFGEPTNWTRIYTQLKNELVNAIDNHPNPEVAGVWKQARDAYAGPAKIKSAYEVGKKVLSDALDANELPFMTAAYSPKELEAIASGIRYQIENQLGRAGAQEGRSIRQILSENNQSKIRWLIGDEKAEKLFNAVDLENQIHGAQKRLIGGSPTAERMLGAEEEFGARPPRSAEIAGQIAETGVGLIKEPKKTVTKAVSKFATEKMARAAEEKAAQLRADIARIYMLQGPERDAALRWILEHGENWTGAPEIRLPGMRATGGSVFDKMHAVRRRAEGGGSPFDDAAEVEAVRASAADMPVLTPQPDVPGTVTPEQSRSVLGAFVPEFIKNWQASPDYDPKAALPEAGKVPRNQPLSLPENLMLGGMEALNWLPVGGPAKAAAIIPAAAKMAETKGAKGVLEAMKVAKEAETAVPPAAESSVLGAMKSQGQREISEAPKSSLWMHEDLPIPVEESTRASTRMPNAIKSTEDPLQIPRLEVNASTMQQYPELYEHNIGLLNNYPGFRAAGTPNEIGNSFKNHVMENLRWLYNQVAPEIRERSKLWYDGARKITDDFVNQYQLHSNEVHPNSSAAAIAVLSPQKDWFQNVSLAERVHYIHYTKKDFKWSPEMDRVAKKIYARPDYQKDLLAIKGKKYKELEDPYEKAMWLRTYDEAHNPKDFHVISPEGNKMELVRNELKKGQTEATPSRVAWGSNNEIAKAIQALEANGDMAKISPLLGEQHKVRSFYNNIVAPNSTRGDVTIDTHAVAAALLRPLSGASAEVMHNFGSAPLLKKWQALRAAREDLDLPKKFPATKNTSITGMNGTYGLYADAYRDLAKELGILPRELQSITWEAVRSLFPDTFKTHANSAKIDDIWRLFEKGRISRENAYNEISKIAGAEHGIPSPDWAKTQH